MDLCNGSTTDPNEEALELATPTDPVVELLKQGAGEPAHDLSLFRRL